MLDDLTMITRRFPGPITIIPVADVHLGAIECNTAAWEAFCNKIHQTPDTYIMLVGDLINNSVRNSVGNPFDESMRPRSQKQMMAEYLNPIKDRILCAVSGNHERRTTKDSDQDITYDIMSKLDIENLYRENIAFVKCGIGERAKGSPDNSYIIACTHGAGGGIYTGAGVNKTERFGTTIDGIDAIITAHTHKGAITRPAKIVVDAINNKITTRAFVCITAESWMHYGGYAARAMLSPSEIANPQYMRLEQGKDGKRKRIVVTW